MVNHVFLSGTIGILIANMIVVIKIMSSEISLTNLKLPLESFHDENTYNYVEGIKIDFALYNKRKIV